MLLTNIMAAFFYDTDEEILKLIIGVVRPGLEFVAVLCSTLLKIDKKDERT